MLTPDQTLAISTFGVGALALVCLWLTREPPTAARHARAGAPSVGGARVAGPGAVPLAPMRSVEPPITPSELVRPFVRITPPADLPTVPTIVVAPVACRLCRDGAEVIGTSCIVCRRPAPARAVTR